MTPYRMKVVYKITYPNGKIYIGQDATDSINYFGTALRSFFRFAAFETPTHSAQIQRVLAIPSKRFTRTLVEFLTRDEVEALLASPDQNTWLGRRDHAFILLAVQTGLRLSEMTALKREDIIFGTGAHVRVIGKGRKERCTPITKSTLAVLKAWLHEPQRSDERILFPVSMVDASAFMECNTC